MKKVALAVLMLLVVSTLPMVSSEPWIKVFEGRVKVGESLVIGNYTIEVTLEKPTMEPCAIVYRGKDILDIARQYEVKTTGDLRVVVGSHDSSRDDVLLLVYYKSTEVRELKPSPGGVFSVNGYRVKVVSSAENEVVLDINGSRLSVGSNSTRTYESLAFAYNNSILKVYAVTVKPTLEANGDYEVYYPFNEVTLPPSGEADIPITVHNTRNEELTLLVNVLEFPKGWKVTVVGGNGYAVGSINVQPGGSTTLTLHVEVPDSYEGTGSVVVTVGDHVVTLKISVVAEGSLKVDVPVTVVEVEAGETVEFPVKITGGKAQLVSLSVDGMPSGWSAYFLLGDKRVRTLSLDGAVQVFLVVEVPRNASVGNHWVDFSVGGNEKRVGIYVYKTHRGEPGEIEVTVRDEEGNAVKGAKIVAGDKKILTDAYGKAKLKVPPGKYELRVEKEGYEGTTEALSIDDGEKKSLEVTLTKLPYYFQVEGEGDTLTVSTGSVGSYSLTIKNLGKNEDTYSLSVRGLPEEWSVEFYYAQSPVRSVRINPGESKDVTLRIIPPYNALPGDHNLTVVIRGSDGEKTVELLVKLIGEYEFHMYPDNPVVSIKAGREGVTYVSLDNTGTAPVTNVKFEVSTPQGWEVRVVPEVVPELGSMYISRPSGSEVISSTQRITLTIKVPKTTPAGTYQITITGKGDQAQASTQITVRVTQSSKSAYIGVLILILTFGVVIWMMRRVGRR
ncbi:PEGA domain-containing protein [Thermococcus indicus]|uniref:PEGA domain-containing protein n=1 Tax=Thermococcus indicus TaxID=2586643 RepID=A0A4Y5SL64_9EURY|nr:NEW3 domain-containing protein [Thermococcus indicus]QDA31628.1 PEGA domain-containing protein [Thermococcus indicus]